MVIHNFKINSVASELHAIKVRHEKVVAVAHVKKGRRKERFERKAIKQKALLIQRKIYRAAEKDTRKIDPL